MEIQQKMSMTRNGQQTPNRWSSFQKVQRHQENHVRQLGFPACPCASVTNQAAKAGSSKPTMSLLCAGVVGAEWGVSETTVVFAGSHVHQFRHGRPRWSRCKMTFYIGSNTVCRYGIGLQTQTNSIHPYTRRRLTSSRIGGCPFCVSDAPGASQRRP
jgi:hypothetical protein